MCWTHAKLALPPVGCRTAAYVVLKFLPSPVLQVEGRVSEDEIEFLGLVQVLEERVGIMIARSASMPRIARFMVAIFHVVGLDSWPYTEMSLMLPDGV